MFGRKKTHDTSRPAVTGEMLAALAPNADLAPTALQELLQQVEHIDVRPGLVNGQLPADRQVFLHKGSIQIQTRSGSMLMLKAGSPCARFPLPRQTDVVSLLAAEPCALISLPPTAETVDAQAGKPLSVRLNADESDALARLREQTAGRQSELPSLPDLALKISQAIDDPETTNEDIGRLIQLDPALTARILSVVNSAAFGGMSKITSIHQATARLGRNKVRSLVYSCLLKSIFKIQSPLLKKKMEQLWHHSAHVAALAFVLGRATPGVDPEQAMLAGLIHDIGAVAAIAGISRYPTLAEREEVLEHAIDSLRAELGMQTLRQWQLLDELGDAVHDAENWERIGSAIPETADVVVLAQMHAFIGTPQLAHLPRIDQVPAFRKLANGELSPGLSLKILDEAAADVREVYALISAE